MSTLKDQILRADEPPEICVGDRIPRSMRILRQWVLWRFEKAGDKWTKVPLQPNGQRASSTDPSTWTDFKTAAKVAAASGGKTGVGFVLNGDGTICLDLDNVYDPEADAIKPWADDIISTVGSYYEMSPTGTGVKIYVKGAMPEGMGTRFPHPDGDGEVEVFANRRFLCVTGQPFLDSDSEVRERESAVRVVAGMLRSWKAQRTEPQKPVAAIPAERTQDRRQLMERATRYLQACPPAIQGSGGDLLTFKIAQHPTRGFLLTEGEAFDAMQEWNSRCEPPWEDHDLRRKIHEAANAGSNVAPGEHLQSDQPVPKTVNGAATRGQVSTSPGPTGESHRQKPDNTPEKTTFVDVDAQYRDFPTSVLPAVLRQFVKVGSRSIGCDEALIAAPLLVCCAACIGTARKLRLKPGWTEPSILWLVIVAVSGDHKSPALELVYRSMRERQRRALRQHEKDYDRWLNHAMAEFEADMRQFKRGKGTGGPPPERPEEPICQRIIADDTTLEALAPILKDNPKGVLIATDELANWFSSHERYKGRGNVSDSAKWLELFGGRALMVDRKTGTPKTLYVPNAAASICGGIQPLIYQKCRTAENNASGLSARFLVVQPPRGVKRWTDAGIDEYTERGFSEVIEQLLSLEMQTVDNDPDPVPVISRLTPSARDLFIAFYNSHAKEQADLSDDLSATWSKLEAYAARLALVIHCVRWASGEIPVEERESVDAVSMQAGIDLVQWFANEARRVHTVCAESPDERNQRELLEWIRRQGGTTSPREMTRKIWRLRNQTDQAFTELSRLVKAGYGRWEQITTKGRPSEVMVLSETDAHRHRQNSHSQLDSDPSVDAQFPSSSDDGFIDPSVLRTAKELEAWT